MREAVCKVFNLQTFVYTVQNFEDKLVLQNIRRFSQVYFAVKVLSIGRWGVPSFLRYKFTESFVNFDVTE
jgi:hypothetical protein